MGNDLSKSMKQYYASNPKPCRDWSNYDDLIKQHLPNMTVRDFTRKFNKSDGFNYFANKISQRAKKLGIKPIKYYPSESHKNATKEGVTKYRITDEQKQFIASNCQLIPAIDIARKLGITRYAAQKWIKELGFTTPPEITKQACTERSKAHIDKAAEASKQKWDDPEFRAIRSKQSSESSKKLWQDPIYRAKVAGGISKVYAETNLRERLSKIGKERYNSDPTVKDILIDHRLLKTSKLSERVALVLEDIAKQYTLTINREYKVGDFHWDLLVELNNRKILLDVNGDYWHNLPENVANDTRKFTQTTKYYPEFDVRYIWEHEVKSSKFIDRLHEILDLKKPQPAEILTLDLEIKNCPNNDARMFISKYHYIGKLGRTSKIHGLYFHNYLIGVAVLAPPVRSEIASSIKLKPKEVIELSRFCLSPYYHNKNLSSWFLSRVLNNTKNDYKAVVSFADTEVEHIGTIYKATNWECFGETSPDYVYRFQSGPPIHKKTVYNRAKAAGLKELEYVTGNNLIKIKTKPKIKYVYWFDRSSRSTPPTSI